MLKAKTLFSNFLVAESAGSNRIPARSKMLALLLMLVVTLVPFTGLPVHAQGQFPVIATIDVAVNPFGATVAPDGGTVWVANSGTVTINGNTVTVIDANTFAIQSTITVGFFPEDIAFARAGTQAFVTNSTSATVSVIDTAARVVTQTVDLAAVPMQFPFGVIASKNDTKVFVTSAGGQRDTSLRNIGILDNTNPANVVVNGAITVQGFTGRPALTPDGSLLIVPRSRGDFGPPEVLLIDPATNQIVDTIFQDPRVGAVLDVAVTPDGRFAYAGIFGGFGGVWVIDLVTRSTVTVIPTLDSRIHGVGITPDGRFVFVTNFILGSVSVISTATNQIVETVPVGNLPNEVTVTPDSTKAFVTNQGATTVSVISIPAP
ncbi:MAG: hypothetical protein L0338_35285 [Acidobacteria bacterium]|nr:hypothetical protein [Acidobacteriota bacterium]